MWAGEAVLYWDSQWKSYGRCTAAPEAVEWKDNQKAAQTSSAHHIAPLCFGCEHAAAKLSSPCADVSEVAGGSQDVWSPAYSWHQTSNLSLPGWDSVL